MSEGEDKPNGRSNYRAFISYSHKDKATATWLHTQLERFTVPKKLIGTLTSLGTVPKRRTPIFRDQDELPASGNLGAELEDALSRSLFLIVICSPASAQSKWVNQEIIRFKMLHGSDKVLALIQEGEPNAELAERECFPPALKFDVSPDGTITDNLCEPIAADLRTHGDGKRLSLLKLISGLTAVQLDDLVQREAARRMRALVQISVASVLAAVFAVGLALYANDRRIDANMQRNIAEQEAANARAVSDFLVKSFAAASSVQDNPNTITARTILDRGAKRIGVELKTQPLIQGRLSATIAMAFTNLGLFDQAIDVVDSTAALSGVEFTRAALVKADALLGKGDLKAAMEAVEYAQGLFEKESYARYADYAAEIRFYIADIQARINYMLGQHDEGLAAYARAIQALESLPKTRNLEMARVLMQRALLLSDIGDMRAASSDLEKAEQLALDSVGSKDILVARIALAQAQVNFLSWELDPALEQIGFAITNMQRILESDNPTLADAISMKGQILHALGELDEAEKALTEAVEVYTQAYKGRHYLSGIAEVYLGLVAGDKKDLSASLAHFAEAKLHYDESYGEIHANHGDLLVNQATVLAALGEKERANQDCEAGMQILEDTLGKESGFTKQLQTVCDDIKAQ
jgi:tetratricopeptide (TPR) repeat protein